MSNQGAESAQGPDWWQASDGRWYPPHLHPQQQAQPGETQPGPDTGSGPAQPGKRKKWPWIVGGLVLVVIVAALASTGTDDDTAATGDPEEQQEADATEPTENGRSDGDTRDLSLYPDRPDRQDDDHEARVGESVRLAGYTATVTSAEYAPELSDFEDDGYLVTHVEIVNRDDEAQPYNVFDWQLLTPAGQVVDPTITSRDQLGSGQLVEGGSVEGDVIFEVGDASGTYYVLYKPDAFNAARGVWGVGL